MKYHPLYGEHSHDRNYIGKHWNLKYIRAVQAVLNVLRDVLAEELLSFIERLGMTKMSIWIYY